jgi:hypothetical protein
MMPVLGALGEEEGKGKAASADKELRLFCARASSSVLKAFCIAGLGFGHNEQPPPSTCATWSLSFLMSDTVISLLQVFHLCFFVVFIVFVDKSSK